MKVITSKELESTGYRCLFECVKQKGIEPVFDLAQGIKNLPDKDILIRQTLSGKKNDLSKLAKKYKKIISYFEEHKKELCRLSLTNENVLNTLTNLFKDISLLDIYLENARRLEKLKVSDVKFVSSIDGNYGCEIYKNKSDHIINIRKYYADKDIILEDEILEDKEYGYSIISFHISDATFLLDATNGGGLYQYRGIHIKDFLFNGSKLPTEEEIQSYEIPKQFIKNI